VNDTDYFKFQPGHRFGRCFAGENVSLDIGHVLLSLRRAGRESLEGRMGAWPPEERSLIGESLRISLRGSSSGDRVVVILTSRTSGARPIVER
jgi:hypothetical protein